MATTATATTTIRYIDLRVVATLQSQNVANNTSTVKFDLYVDSRGGDNWDGMGTTFSLNVGNSWYTPTKFVQEWHTYGGTYHVNTWYHTIDHLADGTRSFSFSGSIDSNYGSGTAKTSLSLPAIPRASEISSFSTNASFVKDKSTSFSFTLDKKESTYISNLSLVHRGNTIETLNDFTGSSGTISISSSNVNKIISRETGTTATIQLRLQTKQSNGTNVGSVQTASTEVNIVSSGLAPSVTSFSRSIIGSSTINNADKTLNKPIDGYTRLRISANASAVLGLRISSVTLRVTGKESYNVSMSYNPSTGKYEALTRVLKGGTYYFDVEARDSRGLTSNYGKQTYEVEDYQLATLENLSIGRSADNSSAVDVKFIAKFTQGVTGNLAIEYKPSEDTGWINIYSAVSKDGSTVVTVGEDTYTSTTLDTISSGVRSVSINQSFTGFSETSSFQFQIKSNDSIITSYSYMYGNVGTARQLLTLNQNKGVGIGKVHQQGVLDVDGSAYFEGDLNTKGEVNITPDPQEPGFISQAIKIYEPNLGAHNSEISFRAQDGALNARIGYFYSGDNSIFGVKNENTNLQLFTANGDVQLRSDKGYATIADKTTEHTHTRVIDYGTTYSNGSYVKLYNGILICWHTMTIPTTTERNNFAYWNYPVEFYSTSKQVIMASKSNYTGGYRYHNGSVGVSTDTKLRAKAVFSFASHDTNDPDNNMDVSLIAIGRWR